MKKKLSEMIYEKDFSRAQFGWKAEEVDKFLDEINSHVIRLENELEKINRDNNLLASKNAALMEKNKKLELENTQLKGQRANDLINIDNYNNVQLVQRISRLEDVVQELVKALKK